MMTRSVLFASALFAGACAGTDAPAGLEKPTDGKADGTSRICQLLGQPSTCDACEHAGWYDDGVCDDFCANPDPDCAGPLPTEVELFLSRPDLRTSYAGDRAQYGSGRQFEPFYDNSFAVTTLSQTSADAWTLTQAAMTGTGLALNMRFRTDRHIAYGPVTVPIDNLTTSSGECNPTTNPARLFNRASVNVFRWAGAQATPIACALGGSITVEEEAGVVRLHVEAELSDGSRVDEVYEATFRY